VTRRKKRGHEPGPAGSDPPPDGPRKEAPGGGRTGEPEIATSGWVESGAKSLNKDFPDPHATNEPLLIALTAPASAEVAAHAKDSLDAEVCGVLVGHGCEDDAGPWVWVKAAIRGDSAREGGDHVTYTQETWRKIHEAKDRQYPDLAIVGWYHSHPGFGVEFSAMDMFIQENFFSGPAQIALVLDPLSGDEAVCVNTQHGIEHVPCFWVDGRRRTCRRPAKEPAAGEADAAGAADDVARRLRAVEERLQQVLQATDEDRSARHFWGMTIGMLVAVGLIAWIAMTIVKPLLTRETPPEDFIYSDVPVRIGEEDALVGVKIIKWKLPAKLHAAFLQALAEQVEAVARQRAEAEQAGPAEAAPEPGEKSAEKPAEKAPEKANAKEKKP
jgi:proteasome lid subunit RPN8/RPN11